MARNEPDELNEDRKLQGQRFRRALEALGVKQVEVARRLGTSSHFIADLAGGRKRATRPFAAYFQTEYHISSHWLLTGEGEMWHLPPADADERAKPVAVPLVHSLPTTFDEIGKAGRQAKVRLLSDLGKPDPSAKRFVLVMPDDSLFPAAVRDDWLLFEAQRAMSPEDVDGSICAVRLGSEELVRRVRTTAHPTQPVVRLTRPAEREGRKVTRVEQRELHIIGRLLGLVWREARMVGTWEDSLPDEA